MKNKAAAGLALALLIPGIAAGCGGPSYSAPGEPKNEMKPFTVSLRHTQVRDDAKLRLKLLDDVAKRMEANVPGLKVELEGIEDKLNRFEKLPAEMAAGTPPKIFDLFGGTDTQKFVKANRLLDLTPILHELGLQNKFYNLEEFTVDGKVYGLPTAGFVEGVYYNKKIFRELGVEVPKTWDEFIAICEKAKARGITPFALASADGWVANMMMNTMWVRTAGPESVNGFLTGGKRWTDPDVLDAFKRYETLVRKGFFQEGSLGLKYAEQQNKFRTGEAAMMFDGSWANWAVVDPEKSKISNDVGFFNFPGVGGRHDELVNGSYSNGYGFSATLNENENKAVMEFIKIMYSEEMQKRQLKESGILPAMKLTDLSGVHPIVGELLDAANARQFPAFDSIVQAKVRETLETGMQELLGNKSSAEKVTEKVQKAQDEANKDTRK